MRPTLVLYDEGCAVCATFAARLAAHPVAVAPIGSPEGDRWLRDLPRVARYAAFHAIDGDGRRRSGGAAVPMVLDALGRRGAARLARATPRVTDAAYRAVARNRGILSHLVGTTACRPVRSGATRASRERAG